MMIFSQILFFTSFIFFVFNRPSMGDAAGALALIQLATLESGVDVSDTAPTTPKINRTLATPINRSPPLTSSLNTTPAASPVRCFKLSHVKRTREDLVTLVYSTGHESMEIPFARGEESTVFYERREKAARLLFDVNRNDVYCTWRKDLVNVIVNSQKWVLFKDSLQQKRYMFGSIQLVVTRHTCFQWKDHEQMCRHCQKRTWRVGCLKPLYLYHVMPLRHDTGLAEKDLSTLEPFSVQQDSTAWSKRVPSRTSR
jgi:hypothetical protein